MAISLSDIHNAYVDYFSSLVVTSITVTPKGSEINPNENFSLTLTAKNSPDDPAQGLSITNVRFHVKLQHPNKAQLVVPTSDVGVAYSDPGTRAPLTPNQPVTEMYLIPHNDIGLSLLGPGAKKSVTIEGATMEAGSAKVTFDVLADLDVGILFPTNQSSESTEQSFDIVS